MLGISKGVRKNIMSNRVSQQGNKAFYNTGVDLDWLLG